MNRLPPRVRDLLVCPKCHDALEDRDDGLCCETCGVVYPIENGIPVLLIAAARPLPRS